METLQLILLLGILAIIFGPSLLAKTTPIPEISEKVHKIASSTELESLLKSTTYVIVDFYADWCPPCRAIAPAFSKLADDHSLDGKLAFAKVNVDHVKDVAKKYDVTAMPTFVVFEKGNSTEVLVKPRNKPQGVKVERIRGADSEMLRALAVAFGENVQKA